MILPSEFISIVTNTFGEDGESLIANLPTLIEEASFRWKLSNIQPVSNLSYNFVATAFQIPHASEFAQTLDRNPNVVLKIGVPRGELASEIAALRLFGGEGACRLIDADEEKGFLLLERLNPGLMLSTLEDDEEATHIAATVMQKIWRPLDQEQVPALQSFILLSDWFNGLKRMRATFGGGTGPLDQKLVERVEHSVKDLFVENHKPVLMHGDFHHFNILSSERGWLIIDPKGVIGPAGYEVGPFLMNPWGELSGRKDYRQIIRRRIDILHERLGFERDRIHEWGLAHAVLSTWWSIEDNTGWEYSLAFAEMIADLDIN